MSADIDIKFIASSALLKRGRVDVIEPETVCERTWSELLSRQGGNAGAGLVNARFPTQNPEHGR